MVENPISLEEKDGERVKEKEVRAMAARAMAKERERSQSLTTKAGST